VTGGAALVVGFRLPARTFAGQAAEQEKKTPNPFDAWVRITPDNRVTLDSWQIGNGPGDHDGVADDPGGRAFA